MGNSSSSSGRGKRNKVTVVTAGPKVHRAAAAANRRKKPQSSKTSSATAAASSTRASKNNGIASVAFSDDADGGKGNGTTGTAAGSQTDRISRMEQYGTKMSLSRRNLVLDDESVKTFARSLADVSAHSRSARRRGGGPVMVTDAISNVRVNYHVDAEELGKGHYGVVRRCMHRRSGIWCAIKSIRKSRVSNLELLKSEIAILKEVDHPNIIKLFEVYEDELYLHLIMELCTGGELFTRIMAKTQSDEGHFSERDAARLVRDILDAIRYCHEKGIVHRDLKPENFLMLTEAEDAPLKIADFGLSCHAVSEKGVMRTKVGSPFYIAPEVLRYEYTNLCDVWSIGVITYILLCGYPPFYGEEDDDVFEAVCIGTFEFASPDWDNISESAKDFVRWLLTSDVKKRPSAAEALEHPWILEEHKEETTEGVVQRTAKENQSKLLHTGSRSGEFANYMSRKKRTNAAFEFFALKLTQQEVMKLEQQFKSIDQDDSGLVTMAQFEEALDRVPIKIGADRTVKRFVSEQSPGDENCKIYWKDFIGREKEESLARLEDNFRNAFHHLEASRYEYLTVDDLAELFGGELRQAKEIVDLLDADCDGKLSRNDFLTLLDGSSLEGNENDDITDEFDEEEGDSCLDV